MRELDPKTDLRGIVASLHTPSTARDALDEARVRFERALPVLALSNQHIDVSIRFWKRVRRAQGLFATDAARAPVPALDAVQAAEAERLARVAIALDAAARESARH